MHGLVQMTNTSLPFEFGVSERQQRQTTVNGGGGSITLSRTRSDASSALKCSSILFGRGYPGETASLPRRSRLVETAGND
jgi:hypothetical protein